MGHYQGYFILTNLDMTRSVKQYIRAVDISVTESKLGMYVIKSVQNLVAVNGVERMNSSSRHLFADRRYLIGFPLYIWIPVDQS